MYKTLAISMKALNKAILFPEEVELDKAKPYPRPNNISLMANPFATAKKGKKG